jgi:hypothetical protein
MRFDIESAQQLQQAHAVAKPDAPLMPTTIRRVP